MKAEIKDLIYSIANGNANETEEQLNSIMSNKAMAALDNMRVEVSKTMFNQKEPAEE